MGESGGHPLYSCNNCRTPLAFHGDLLSKKFKAKSGQAYMFSHVMNVVLGEKVEKQLLTGAFKIADIRCSGCGQGLGWKYVVAYDVKQKYKEGNFILEISKLLKQY
ncbi:Protein yippee-like At4g27740 [Linum grandiflorum]